MIAGAKQSMFCRRTWYATVDDKAKCDHLHRTSAAAIKCAQRWIAFQHKVEQLRIQRDMLRSM